MPVVASRFSHVSVHEAAQIKDWHQVHGKSAAEIASLLGRNPGTIARHIARINAGQAMVGAGRPRELTDEQVGRLVSKARSMIQAADAKYQVTAGMIKDALGYTCCDRVILEALHSHGLYFHPLREKPVLSAADETARFEFAEQHLACTIPSMTRTSIAWVGSDRWASGFQARFGLRMHRVSLGVA
jgi:transposase